MWGEIKNKIIYSLPSLIFNVVEISIIILVGILMQVKIEEVIILILLFFIARVTSYNQMHYKSPILCMIWSTLVFFSFFLLTKVNLYIAIVFTVFEGVILTGRGDVRDGFLYSNTMDKKKYKELEIYIQNNRDSQNLKEFERILKRLNQTYSKRYRYDFYQIYTLKFLENKSFEEIKKETNIRDNHGVTRALDVIFMSFNTYLETLKESDYRELAKTS